MIVREDTGILIAVLQDAGRADLAAIVAREAGRDAEIARAVFLEIDREWQASGRPWAEAAGVVRQRYGA